MRKTFFPVRQILAYSNAKFVTKKIMAYLEKLLNGVPRFGNFTECNCNVVARSAAHAVARYKGDAGINPFVVIGGTGLGKTHLLNSMVTEIQMTQPLKKIYHQPAQKFVSSFSESVRGNFRNEFLNTFESVDYIVIDDLQVIVDKEQTQKVFIQILDAHLNQKKQIILAASPELKKPFGCDERLLSILNGGLTVYLEVPSFDDRMLLLKEKIKQFDPSIDEEILVYMAQKNLEDIRALEGFLISAWVSSIVNKVPMDIKWVEDAYQKLFNYAD